MPALSMSTYCSVWEPKVWDLFWVILPNDRAFYPAFSAIWRIGASSAGAKCQDYRL